MGDRSTLTESQTADYIKQVSIASNLNLSEDRQKAQVKGFQRLLNEANDLNVLVSKFEHIETTPITVYRR